MCLFSKLVPITGLIINEEDLEGLMGKVLLEPIVQHAARSVEALKGRGVYLLVLVDER